MAYNKQTWRDLPDQTTPINSSRLNHIEDGIYDNSMDIITLQGEILWENSDTSIDFVAGTITLNQNLNDFDMYEILFLQSTTNQRTMSTGRIPVGSGTILSYVTSSNYYRPTSTTISGNTVTFEDAQMSSGGTSTTQNNTVIPIYVIGYKTGLLD